MVLTRDSAIAEQGALVFDQLEKAIASAEEAGEQELMVIGGAQLYAATFNMADRIYLTRVHQHYAQAQVHFPDVNADTWDLSKQVSKPDVKAGILLDFCCYERKR
jgi:dihydrofolate reductase